jgi:hypothetical protein
MTVSSEERQILDFLEANPEAYFSMIEICRKAGSARQFREDRRWAVPFILRLRDSDLIEDDGQGHYRCKRRRD